MTRDQHGREAGGMIPKYHANYLDLGWTPHPDGTSYPRYARWNPRTSSRNILHLPSADGKYVAYIGRRQEEFHTEEELFTFLVSEQLTI